MNWFEIYHNASNGTWDVYRVTANGQCFQRYKVLKTEAGARSFAQKHWVRRWVED